MINLRLHPRERKVDLGAQLIGWMVWIILAMLVAAVIHRANAETRCRYIQGTGNILCETAQRLPRVIEAVDDWKARTRPLWLEQGFLDSWHPAPLSPICGIVNELCPR